MRDNPAKSPKVAKFAFHINTKYDYRGILIYYYFLLFF